MDWATQQNSTMLTMALRTMVFTKRQGQDTAIGDMLQYCTCMGIATESCTCQPLKRYCRLQQLVGSIWQTTCRQFNSRQHDASWTREDSIPQQNAYPGVEGLIVQLKSCQQASLVVSSAAETPAHMHMLQVSGGVLLVPVHPPAVCSARLACETRSRFERYGNLNFEDALTSLRSRDCFSPIG